MNAPNLERYLRASKKLDLAGIDFDAVGASPLSPNVTRCLTYMMDIETHTVIYLKDLLSTPAAEDPDVTAFLSLWVYEEFWHGEALSRFLRAAGERFEPDRARYVRRYADRTRSALATAAKYLGGRWLPSFVAVHMTWGAINELSTLTAYQRVIATTDHPQLRELLSRIIKDERRHYAFYFNQARERMQDDPRAQRVVRFALEKFWAPVGTGVRPQSETDFVIACLFGGPDGASAVGSMEAEISKLPGLAGLHIISDARARALGRTPASSRGLSPLPIAAAI